VNVTLSSNVAFDNIGVITRRITNLTEAAKENGNSRVFGGVSSHLSPHLIFNRCLYNGALRFIFNSLQMRVLRLETGWHGKR